MNYHNLFVLLVGFGAAVTASAGVDVVPVVHTTAAAEYVVDGTVQAIKQSVVSAQVSGRVLQLLVRVGDRVVAGQVVARLDNREWVATEDASSAAILEAQANLARANSDFKRTQELARRNFVSAAALDQAETQVKALRARVGSLQASSRAAGATRSHALIAAPYSGVVAATHIEAGDMAMPGKPVISIFEPGRMRVVSYVPETRMDAVRASLTKMPPAVEIGGLRLAGVQTSIVPVADSGTRTTEIRIDLPENVSVVPGQFVRTRFPLAVPESPSRLSIPEAAVLRRGELTAVYVRTGESFLLRQIRLGETLPNGSVEVLAGLKAGEDVALDPVRAGIEAVAAPVGK